MKFKIDDRVAFYNTSGRREGTISKIKIRKIISGEASEMFLIVQDESGRRYGLHPKQCRLLVKKRRIWIENYEIIGQAKSALVHYSEPFKKDNFMEFVQVKKK